MRVLRHRCGWPARPRRGRVRARPPATRSSRFDRAATRRHRSRRGARCDHRRCARRRRPLRGVDRGRRVRERSRSGVRRQRARRPLGRRGMRTASAPTSCTSAPTTSSTARKTGPYDEWDEPNPQSRVRRVEAGRRARGAGARARRPPSCARRGCAASTAPTWSRPSCAWPASATAAGLRRRPGRPPDVHAPTSRRCSAGWPSIGAAACTTSPTRARSAGTSSPSGRRGDRARPGDGAGRSPPPTCSRRVRRRARPTACSTTPSLRARRPAAAARLPRAPAELVGLGFAA